MKLYFDHTPLSIAISNEISLRVTSQRKGAKIDPLISFTVAGELWGTIYCSCEEIPPEMIETFTECMNIFIGNTLANIEEGSHFSVEMQAPKKFDGPFIVSNHQIQFEITFEKKSYTGFLQYDLAKKEQFFPLQHDFGEHDYA